MEEAKRLVKRLVISSSDSDDEITTNQDSSHVGTTSAILPNPSPNKTERTPQTVEKVRLLVSSSSSSSLTDGDPHDEEETLLKSNAFVDCVSASPTVGSPVANRREASDGRREHQDRQRTEPLSEAINNIESRGDDRQDLPSPVSPAPSSPSAPSQSFKELPVQPFLVPATLSTPEAPYSSPRVLVADGEGPEASGSPLISGRGLLQNIYADQVRRRQWQQHHISRLPSDEEVRAAELTEDDHEAKQIVLRDDKNLSGRTQTPPRRQRHADTSEWVSARRTALDQLRAELEHTAVVHTPSASPAAGPAGQAAHVGGSDSPASPLRAAATATTIRPNLSGISHISPEKVEASSMLVDTVAMSYNTPSPPQRRAARRVPPRSSPSASPKGRASFAKDAHVPGEQSRFLEQKALRQEELRRTVRAKEMFACTFQPTIAPGTTALLSASGRPPSAEKERAEDSNSTVRDSETVYERLYPARLTTAGAAKRQRAAQRAYRDLARVELQRMRETLGALFSPHDARENPFDIFLSNTLNRSCFRKSTRTLLESGILVKTPYVSHMSATLNARRRHASGLGAAAVSHKSSRQRGQTSAVSEAEDTGEYRIALFDEFLQRQNAYFSHRARTVQVLEQSLTPEFTPSTSPASAKLMKKMIERSILNASAGPDTSAVLAQKQAQHVPMGHSLVPKRTSSYVDAHSFRPQISPAARRGAIRRRHEDLYLDYKRYARLRESARLAVRTDELKDCTFEPQLNTRRNASVQSLLEPGNYEQYEQYLRKKREALHAKKMERAAAAAKEEGEPCTFRPKISKKPAYIDKMASSFALVRNQNVEF